VINEARLVHVKTSENIWFRSVLILYTYLCHYKDKQCKGFEHSMLSRGRLYNPIFWHNIASCTVSQESECNPSELLLMHILPFHIDVRAVPTIEKQAT
jgi:hypothetical protein